MPPWPPGELASQRKARLGVNNPRYADLPPVCSNAEGVIEVLRSDPSLAETLAGNPEARPGR